MKSRSKSICGPLLAVLFIFVCATSGRCQQPASEASPATAPFQKEAFSDLQTGKSITLVSPTQCEIQEDDAPKVLAEYMRDGNRLRVVSNTQGTQVVNDFEVTDTAKKKDIHIPGFVIAGKTGTAQKVEENAAGYENQPAQPAKAQVLVKVDPATIKPIHRKQLANQILMELRIVDAAIDQWAIENGKAAGVAVPVKELADYIKAGTPLHQSCVAGQCVDSLGNPISVTVLDTPPTLSRASFQRLLPVVGEDFWKPYKVSE